MHQSSQPDIHPSTHTVISSSPCCTGPSQSWSCVCVIIDRLRLGESIAANNAYRQREAELSVKRVAVSDVPPPLGNSLSGPCPSSPSNQGIHNLIEKLQNSMEVCVCV